MVRDTVPPHTLAGLASILNLERIQVTVAGVPVVVSATCTVGPGECLAILGPNGAGKTTLLRVMATLLRPSAGRGSVLGVDLESPAVDTVRPRIGLAGHLPALSPFLTLAENLTFVARLQGRPQSVVPQALEMVGLASAAGRLADRCSHGMRKRADLARLLLTQPDLLLLDEPHAGLDSSAGILVAELVARTRARGGGAVLVSHDPTSLVDLADRHLTLRAGSLAA